VLKSRGNHVNCCIQTLNVIGEQQEAVLQDRVHRRANVGFFSSQVFFTGLHVHQFFYLKVKTEI